MGERQIFKFLALNFKWEKHDKHAEKLDTTELKTATLPGLLVHSESSTA